MNNPDRKIKIEHYEKAYEEIIHAIKEFPAEMWQYKPSNDRWSIHEILIHIADSEVNSYSRCRKIIAESGTKIFGYNQDKWSAMLMYIQQDTDTALELFRLLRKLTFDLIKNLDDDVWSRTADHEFYGPITLDNWLEMYEPHIPGHISQMKGVYQEWLTTKSRK